MEIRVPCLKRSFVHLEFFAAIEHCKGRFLTFLTTYFLSSCGRLWTLALLSGSRF